jgi:vacuolar-type H+-ATPase subunit E/Vma4
MDRPTNMDRIRDLLREWASEQEQRRLWLSEGLNGAEVSSFSEARECLLTDTGFGLEKDRGRAVVDNEFTAMLRRFEELLATIDENRAPNDIIADPKMRDVRLLAKQLLAALPPGSG